MKRGAFTLIELLVIVAIIGIMVMTAVLGVVAGQKAVRVKGATRDVFAAIRQARSVALVTQQPVIIKYSTGSEDGEPVAKVEIVSTKLMDTQTDRSGLQTITGGPLPHSERESVHVEKAGDGESAPADEGGTSVEDILFAPVHEEVVRGMRLKVLRGDESLEPVVGGAAKKKISIFSNVDYLLGRYDEARAAAKKQEEEKKKEESSDSSASSGDEGTSEEVKIIWESNGRVEPHKVWIYPDGKSPQDGLMVKIDAFGGAKVLSGDERE